MSKYRIAVSNSHNSLEIDARTVRVILRRLLAESIESADVSVAVIGDEQMLDLNKRFLGRSSTTDVLAFPYEQTKGHMEGEVVVNADEAERQAARRAHGAEDELLLYAVHGVLHLMGCDDQDGASRAAMHSRALDALKEAGHVLDS